MNKAEELIACLEGEIAKRDARIVELEGRNESLDFQARHNYELASKAANEVAEIKAREPVAAIPDGYSLVPSRIELSPQDIACIMLMCGGDEEATEVDEQFNGGVLWVGNTVGDEGELTHGLHIACVECMEEGSATIAEFTAPVYEAKAQGVVMHEPLMAAITRADDVLHALSNWESSSVKLEQRHGQEWTKEVDAIRRELHTQLARLNAAPVQQVSVPDGADQFDTPAEFLAHQLLIKRSELLGRPLTWREAIELTALTTSMPDAEKEKLLALDDPAPAAPAADSGLVEALEHARLFIVNGIDLGFIQMPEAGAPDPAHEMLPMIDAALAAHRAKGVV